MLIDIGANLSHKSFRGDLGAVLERARKAGVSQMVVTGTSLRASEDALELAKRHALVSTAGIHPHEARTASEHVLRSLRGLAAESRVVAVGECGLDYDRDFSPRPEQRRAFEAQLELGAALGKPVFLHERAAHADFIEILRRHRPRLTKAVVHCFTGSEAELDAYLALDLHIGITGWVADERRGRHLLGFLGKIPKTRLMIETDAPFLLPRTLTPRPASRRNEPAFLTEVLKAVARARGEPEAELARSTSETARAFFGLDAVKSA